MQICFVIDTSPPTAQRYTTSHPQSNINSSLSMLEIMKYNVEVTLHQLVKMNVLLKDNTIFHLFDTGRPTQPVASFEHDILHFMYQVLLV